MGGPLKVIRWIIGLGLAIPSVAIPATESSPQAKRAMSVAAGHALQGDMGRALAGLDAVPATEFGTTDGAARACMKERFGADRVQRSTTGSRPGAPRAIAVYRAYWRASLLDPQKRSARKSGCKRRLHGLRACRTARRPHASPT